MNSVALLNGYLCANALLVVAALMLWGLRAADR